MEEMIQHLVTGLPTLILILIIVGCILLLCKGADWAIEGVVHLACRTGVPRIVIGATIVSLGTTLPEAFISVMAAWTGNAGLALGNGVGSIIADTGLILGLTCLLTYVPVNRYILDRTGWWQVGTATLLVIVASLAVFLMQEPKITRLIGFFFLLLLVLYIYCTYYWAKTGGGLCLDEEITYQAVMSIGKSLLMIFAGLLLVIIGARILVPSAGEIAIRFGVPQDIIAATMVALGTSLPELMTAITSVRKGHPEIMVGNVVGADVLNCLFVIGASAAARPLEIPMNFFYFHFPAMLLILYSFRFFIAINNKGYFRKWQGGWLLGIYVLYIVLQYSLNVNSTPAG